MTYELGELELIIAPDGEVLQLGDGQARAVLSVGGRGAPPVEYKTVRGYRQQSETVVDWLLQPRALSLTLAWAAATRAEYWALRRELVAFMRPNRGGPLRLRHVRADGTQREIEAYPDSSPVFEAETPWETLEEKLDFICYDPTFYDPQAAELTFASETKPYLAFPLQFPIAFSSRTQVGVLQSVTYTGDFPAYPAIAITGPYTGLTLTHVTTGARIRLGQPIGPGQERHIITQPGRVAVTDEAGVSRFNEFVLPETDLLRFNLRPAGKASTNPFEGVPGGVNLLRVDATGHVGGQTAVTVSYHTRFLSL